MKSFLRRIFGFFRGKGKAHLFSPGSAPSDKANTTMRTAEDLERLIGAACDGDRMWQGLRGAVTLGGIQRLRSMADRLGAA